MEARTGLGFHETPAELATRLAAAGLAGAPAEARVLDPACGTGALLEAAAAQGVPGSRLFGIELEPDRAAEARRRLKRHGIPPEHVRCADALESDWPAAEVVLANPPWASFSGRQAAAREAAGPAAPGWPSLHGAFLERIARHLAQAPGGRAAVLLPASVCHLDGYAGVRERVDGLVRLSAPPRELGEDRFPGVVEPAIELVLVTRRSGDEDANDWSVPAARDTVWQDALEQCAPLPPESFGDIGVHSGNAARRLVRPLERLGSHAAPVREGRDLVPYRLAAPRKGLDLALERTPEVRFRMAPLERYRAVPIVVRQTADRPLAALHEPAEAFRNSLLACWAPSELDPAFVVAVLNGPVSAAWHRAAFADARQRSFPQVKVGHLRALPFPLRARDEAPQAHDRIASACRALHALSETAPARTRVIATLERSVVALYDLPEDLVEALPRSARAQAGATLGATVG